jgi:hypothetical protein
MRKISLLAFILLMLPLLWGQRIPDQVPPDRLYSFNTPADGQCLTFQAAGRAFKWASCGSGGPGGGDNITVNSVPATDPDFANADIDWTLTGGSVITATVGCTDCVTLGTETAGNYVASLSTTSPLTGGAPGSEGASLTLGLTQHSGTDITTDLEEETHAAEHAVGGADSVFAPDPNTNACWTWDDAAGSAEWGAMSDFSYSGTAWAIGAGKVQASHLKAVDAPADEECLTYETTGGDFEWQPCGSGGGGTTNSFETIATPSGTSPVADSSTDTLTLSAGAGLTITGNSTTDTITFASKGQMLLSCGSNTSHAATFYCSFGSTGTSTDQEFIVPAITCTSIHAQVDTAPGAGNTWTVNLWRDGSATSLSCSISGASTSCSATGNVSIPAGSLVIFEFLEIGSAASTAGQSAAAVCYFS